jgi:hypothetical protein
VITVNAVPAAATSSAPPASQRAVVMTEDHRVDLRDQRIQQAGDRGDQDERTDENTCVEMQSQQQRSQTVEPVAPNGGWVKLVVVGRGHNGVPSFAVGAHLGAQQNSRAASSELGGAVQDAIVELVDDRTR